MQNLCGFKGTVHPKLKKKKKNSTHSHVVSNLYDLLLLNANETILNNVHVHLGVRSK